MQKNIFDITKFNLIQDEEYYYLFRSLEDGDNYDVENGITVDENGNIIRIRTDRERWEETSSEVPKYNSSSSVSLEEVYDHIKMHYRRDTNCISFTSNANVAVSYGKVTFSDEYVMIKVSKKDFGTQVINAGEYMLAEVEKRIKSCIEGLDTSDPKVQEILSKIQELDVATSTEEISQVISVKFTQKKGPELYHNSEPPKIEFAPPTARVSNWQALDEEQVLEKNRLIAKLTLLERSGLMKPIIPNARDNNFLIQTIGNAFSSLEQIHYGNIESDKIINVQRELVYILGLLQQVPEELEGIEELKQELINFINDGKKIDIPETSIDFEQYKLNENISIDELYEQSQGRIPYGDVSNAVKKIFYLSKSQLYARELATVLRGIVSDNQKYERIIEYIENNCFNVEAGMVTRLTNRGYKISESVNLDIRKQEEFLVSEVRRLTDRELLEILENGGNINIKDTIISQFSVDKEQVSIEEYYAEAIIESINWKEIGIVGFSENQKNEFIKRLVEQDSRDLYLKLQSVGIPKESIPLYIMNIVTNKNLRELIDSENFAEHIKENKTNFEQKLSITQIEEFLDFYKIEGTELRPRDYQIETIENIDRILNDEKFAAAILPTGAGKSFIALIEMLKYQNEPILYLAPQDEILNQMKELILKYVVGKNDSLDIDADIAKAFPNLKFETYPGLNSKEGKELVKQKYGFIVLDELHRTGAEEWEKHVDKLLENQDENVKVLGITATQTRDVDSRNMADETALKLGYSEEDVKNGKHIAKELDLQTAIQLGIVVNPKIISFIYKLNKELVELADRINKLEDGNAKKTLQEEYERIQSQYEQTRKYVSEAEGMSDILEDNLKEGGRYIVFIPVGNNGELEDEDGNKRKKQKGKQSGKQKIEEYKKKIAEEYLKDSKFTPKFFSMLGEYGEKRNREELKGFEKDDSTDVKFLIVMNKANEGLHISGLDGMIWLRDIDEDSYILMLQQLGRIIYSEDPNNPTKEEDRPIVIDASNNILKLFAKKDNKKRERRSDLTILTEVVSWCKRHNQIPDIDSSSKREQIYAASLYRIKEKYGKYLENPEELESLTEEEFAEISQILNKGSELDLWGIYLPPREKEEIEAKAGIQPFAVESIVTDLIELQGNIKVQEEKTVVAKTLEVARILHKNGIDLSKIQLTKTRNGERKDILLKELQQNGIDIMKIIEQEGLDENFEWGKNVNTLRLAVRGTVQYAITEAEKKEARKLGLVPNEKTVVAQTLEIAEILRKYDIDLSKIPTEKKGRMLLLKDIRQKGIDIEQIIRKEGLDGDYQWGQRVIGLRKAYNKKKREMKQDSKPSCSTDEPTTSSTKQCGQTITPKQMQKAEKLGLIRGKDKSKVAQALHIARILKANNVDLSKLQLSKRTKGERHFFILSEIQQEGRDIAQIIKDNGLDGTFQFGRTVTVIREQYSERKRKQENADNLKQDNSGNKSKKRENNGYKIEGDELDEAFDLGLIPLPAKTIVAQTLEIAKILEKHNVDFSKIEFRMRYKNGEPVGLLLEEIQQDGIDIKGIIQKYNLDGKFDFVRRVLELREACGKNKDGYAIKPEEKEEAARLKLLDVNQEKEKSAVAQTLEIARKLKKYNIDLSQIPSSATIDGKNRCLLLKELEINQAGIDLQAIIKSERIDPDYPWGQRVKGLREAYNKLKSGIKSNSNGNVIEPEEAEEAKLLGLIPINVVEQTINIARKLQKYGIDLKTVPITTRKDGKAVPILLREMKIQKTGIDFQEIIKSERIDPDYPWGQRIRDLRAVYSGSGSTTMTDEEKKTVESVGLISEKLMRLEAAKKSRDVAQELNTTVKEKEEELNRVGTGHEDE